MKTTRGILTFGAIAGLTLSTLGYAAEANIDIGPAVFVMTNDATTNEVIAYERNSYGTLYSPQWREPGLSGVQRRR